ncbi:Phospholipid methyltransferase domain containing protein [Elaphomyces granulatus]
MSTIFDYIDFSQKSLPVAALSIAFNPIFWKSVSQLLELRLKHFSYGHGLLEYRKRYLTRIFGNPYYGCYFLALLIFFLGIFRDHLYHEALHEQPYYKPVHQPLVAAVLFGVGNVLVLSSMWALGLTGTYLGDYFGILMDAPVTGFPFNVSSAPMYWGSTMSFLGVALYKGKPAGLLLVLQVFIMYWLALRWEDPFTAEIYAKRERERRKLK